VKRLNSIENLDIKHNEATLREKMKKLDDLDEYTRNKIKNEIATERVNYVALQRNAIENRLTQKLMKKLLLTLSIINITQLLQRSILILAVS
jgi:hypothetical protein